MESREFYKEKIESQLAKWKTSIERMKTRIERAEVDAKAKLYEQLDGLQGKRAKAEKLLADISATSQQAWDEIKSGVEHGWRDLSRTAKKTMDKVREAIATPNRDEEIRQIAYYLWLDEGCPHGRQHEHWLKAEAIWRERQAATVPAKPGAARTKRSTSSSPRPKRGAGKPRGRRAQETEPGGTEKM